MDTLPDTADGVMVCEVEVNAPTLGSTASRVAGHQTGGGVELRQHERGDVGQGALVDGVPDRVREVLLVDVQVRPLDVRVERRDVGRLRVELGRDELLRPLQRLLRRGPAGRR
jgi:hypothetical protein